MSEPAITVIIPTHRRREALETTLASLARSAKPAGYRGTIVVENASDVSRDVVVQFDSALKIEYLQTPIAGKGHALNLALRGVSDGLIVFFDDDVIVEDKAVVEFAKAAESWGRGHFFGGSWKPEWKGTPDVRWKDYFPLSMVESPDLERGPVDRVLPFMGYNWAVWAEDLADLEFDVRYGPGGVAGATGDEGDMQRRLFARGVTPVFLPDCRVRHLVYPRQTRFRWILWRRFRIGISHGIRAVDSPGMWPRRMYSEMYWLARGLLGMVLRVADQERWTRWILRSAHLAGIAYAGVVRLRPGFRDAARSVKPSS